MSHTPLATEIALRRSSARVKYEQRLGLRCPQKLRNSRFSYLRADAEFPGRLALPDQLLLGLLELTSRSFSRRQDFDPRSISPERV